MVQNPHKRFEYERARFLRRKGRSYNEIVRDIKVSKSTVSLWSRDIVLTKEQKEKLRRKVGKNILLGALANKTKRKKEIEIIKNNARDELQELNLDVYKIAGAILYWAEGTKKKNTSISNSDPRVIKFFVKWLDTIMNIKPHQLNPHLHIHYGNDEGKIKRYWSKLTEIPLKNFGKSFIKPKGTGHRTNILPNGIIRIRVAGIGTDNLRHRILAWIEKIYELSQQL